MHPMLFSRTSLPLNPRAPHEAITLCCLICASILTAVPSATADDRHRAYRSDLTAITIDSAPPGPEEGTTRILGAVTPDPVHPRQANLGFILVCTAEPHLSAHFSLGFFPPGNPVQFTITDAKGETHAHGPEIVGGPHSGFHDPVITEPAAVRAIVDQVLERGAMFGNRNHILTNRLTRAENQRLRTFALSCLQR